MSVTAQDDTTGASSPRRWLIGAVVVVLIAAGSVLAQVADLAEPPRSWPPPPALDVTPSADGGIWISAAEIRALATRGPAWEAVRAFADEDVRRDDASLDERNDHNLRVLARALVAARQDDDRLRGEVRDALRDVVETTDTDDVLAAARRLGTYAIAADVVRLETYDPPFDAMFRAWLREMLTTEHDDGDTIVSVHERRPNNWGTHAGAARIAVAAYLGDAAEVARGAQVFRGWLGDRSSYAGFEYGDLSWQCHRSAPVGINAVDCTIAGHDVGGVLPDDQRRGGDFDWPPPGENYVWEALQGATMQAHLLYRQGYDAWAWENRALRRAVTWLHDEADFPAEGDDTWVPWLVNDAYGTDFPARSPSAPGKNVGFTDWTHAGW